MRTAWMLIAALLLVGCESTPVADASKIKTKLVVKKDISLPAQYPVALYVDKSRPETGINFFGQLEEVSLLVAGDMFSSAEVLSAESQFQQLFKISAVSDWNFAWGGFDTTMTLTVVDAQGNQIYQRTRDKNVGGNLNNDASIFNGYAKLLKEMLIVYVNAQGQTKLTANVEQFASTTNHNYDLKALIDTSTPASSGTGFFINDQGTLATAAHVVDQCLVVEVNHGGKTIPAKVTQRSKLLDIAVLDTDIEANSYANIPETYEPVLGKSVFATGYPLSGILADYPSLTIGNLSSRGGLKGAKGQFQFSAPIQPGNSGGAIVDYQGNMVGLVTSSLNQRIMLTESGTVAQNVNFGIEHKLVKKFFDNNKVQYQARRGDHNFEQASQDATSYSNQVLCYK